MFKQGVFILGSVLSCAVCAQDIVTPPPAEAAPDEGAYDPSFETEESSPWYRPSLLMGWRVTAGPSIQELSFDYYRPGESGAPAGTMTEGMHTTYFIRVGTPYRLSRNKVWGWYLEWEYSDFSMTEQTVGDDDLNLGTEVSGYSGYLQPVGFVLWGPPPSGDTAFSLISGMGLGLGYIKAEGNMILTEDGSNETLVVDRRGVTFSVGLFAEVHYWNLMSRLYFGGATDGEYGVFNLSWDFGYTLSF